MNRCFIVCALDCVLDFEPDENDYVIGADRGYYTLIKNNIPVDLAVGDFDSCELPNDFENTVIYPIMKDETDSAIAIKHAIEKGYNKIIMYGAVGGTLDHTIANLSLMCSYAEQGVEITLIDGENAIFACHNSKIKFTKEAKGRISVFSHSDLSKGVSENGLLYSLNNYDLDNKTSLGSGNSFTGKDSEISVKDGTLIIYTKKNNLNYLTKE